MIDMSIKLLNELRTRRVGSSSQRAVLKSLCYFMNEEKGQCNPSSSMLVQDTELNKNTLFSALSKLIEIGVVEIVASGYRNVNHYAIHLDKLPLNDYGLLVEENNQEKVTSTKINTTTSIKSNTTTSINFKPSTYMNFNTSGTTSINFNTRLVPNLIQVPVLNFIHRKEDKEKKGNTYLINKSPTPDFENPKSEKTTEEVKNSKTPLLENISQPKVEESEFFLTGESEQKTKAAVKTKSKARTHKFDLEELPEKWREYCQFMRAELDPERTFVEFKFYYTQGNGQDVLRSDKGWSQCWQGWIRRHQQTKNQFLDNPNLGKGTNVPSNNPLAENCPQDKIIACYHEVLPNNPPVIIWNTEKRINQLKDFWRALVLDNEITEEQKGLDLVKWVFSKVKVANSLNGQGNNGFKADLEFITSPNNLPRIIEGFYSYKPQQQR